MKNKWTETSAIKYLLNQGAEINHIAKLFLKEKRMERFESMLSNGLS